MDTLTLFDLDPDVVRPLPRADTTPTRSAAKPTSGQRRAPYFAAGWDGDPATALTCRDCTLDCYVGLAATDPSRAEVAHIDPSDQRWFSTREGWSNVTVCCRACNQAQGNRDLRAFGIAALAVTRAHVAASVDEAAARQADITGKGQRRRAARAAARTRRLRSQAGDTLPVVTPGPSASQASYGTPVRGHRLPDAAPAGS